MTELSKLSGFLAELEKTDNFSVKLAVDALPFELTNNEDPREELGDEVSSHPTNGNTKRKLNDEDKFFQRIMPAILDKNMEKSCKTESHSSTLGFGEIEKSGAQSLAQKFGSAYVADTRIKDFSKEVQKDAAHFIDLDSNPKVIQYGMVVKELLPKVDRHNFDQALVNVSKSFAHKSISGLKDEFFKQAADKFILMLNDRIIDGHHFLAKAKVLGVTNSLKVLDLTPVRFQKKASLWETLKKHHVKGNNSRPVTA